MSFTILEELGAKLRRLEIEVNRSPVRNPLGGSGASQFPTVFFLPALPTAEAGPQIVFLHSIDILLYQTALPVHQVIVPRPNPLDSYWWAGPDSTEWTRLGGSLGDLEGTPGNGSLI